MQSGLRQRTLDQVVVERGSFLAQEECQALRASLQIRDRRRSRPRGLLQVSEAPRISILDLTPSELRPCYRSGK